MVKLILLIVIHDNKVYYFSTVTSPDHVTPHPQGGGTSDDHVTPHPR